MCLMSVMMCLMHADERMYNCVSDDMSVSHNVQESKLNVALKTVIRNITNKTKVTIKTVLHAQSHTCACS